jgi:glycosyltransferase involved in cell wall biosynthesis
MLAFHQSAYISALAEIPGVEVVWCVKEEVAADRLTQGWKRPNTGKVEVIVDPDSARIDSILSDRQAESIHIFTGIFQEPLAREAFYKCCKTKAKIGLLNEPPFPGKLRDLLSPFIHRGHRLLFGRYISFILAIGQESIDFYSKIGYRKEIIFPFGYFLDSKASLLDSSSDSRNESPVRLAYVGQFVERKGVDLLIDALGTLKDISWEIDLVGKGDLKDALIAKSQKTGIEDRLNFIPPMNNADAMKIVANSDLVVLPSRHDGWGVNVNEALLQGVPVVCTDKCGSSYLIQDPMLGSVAPAYNSDAFALALKPWILKGHRTPEERIAIRSWSECIAGKSAANYLYQILTHLFGGAERSEIPTPPWKNRQLKRIYENSSNP